MTERLQGEELSLLLMSFSDLCKFKCLCLEGRNSILRVYLFFSPPISSHVLLTEEKHEIVCVHRWMERSGEWNYSGIVRYVIV